MSSQIQHRVGKGKRKNTIPHLLRHQKFQSSESVLPRSPPTTTQLKRELKTKERALTENDVDAEVVPPYQPRDPFHLVRLQGRPNPELRTADRLAGGGGRVRRERDARGRFEPLLVPHVLRSLLA